MRVMKRKTIIFMSVLFLSFMVLGSSAFAKSDSQEETKASDTQTETQEQQEVLEENIKFLPKLSSASVQAMAGAEKVSVYNAEEITTKIVDSATTYLSETANYENLNNAPEAAQPVDPLPRMVIPASDYDIYVLSCQVHAESNNQPYEGKLAVANVIINRVKSPLYPDNIVDVIYQPGQFPPAYTGVLDNILANGPSEECVKAAYDALYGNNNIGDFLYFNMASAVNKSLYSRVVQIADQTFYMP